MSINRIRIVGGCGSGKSYLAKYLSVHLNIPNYDLDDVFWDNAAHQHSVQKSDHAKTKELSTILQRKRWICEGVYKSQWVHPTFQKADLIILIKPSKLVTSYRITKRFIARKLKLLPNKKKEAIKPFIELFRWNWHYEKKDFPQLVKQLSEFKEKIEIIDSTFKPKDVLSTVCRRNY
jgi:adenylate kinase family enzyme